MKLLEKIRAWFHPKMNVLCVTDSQGNAYTALTEDRKSWRTWNHRNQIIEVHVYEQGDAAPEWETES
jgi:hypothetical protein